MLTLVIFAYQYSLNIGKKTTRTRARKDEWKYHDYRGNSVQCTPPPHHIERGTVSLPTSSRCERTNEWTKINFCTSTAADVHSGPVLRETQQAQDGGNYDRLVKAKFHYAIWFEAGSKLLAERFEAKFHYAIWSQTGSKQNSITKPNSITLSGRRQVQSWSLTCSEQKFGLLSSTSCRSATGFKHVCDQIA